MIEGIKIDNEELIILYNKELAIGTKLYKENAALKEELYKLKGQLMQAKANIKELNKKVKEN